MMASKSRVLYTGVTNDIRRRISEHKNKFQPNSFTAKYNINQLVWYDSTSNINDAIAYEKKIKGWLRSKKIELIESVNPNWNDLSMFLD